MGFSGKNREGAKASRAMPMSTKTPKATADRTVPVTWTRMDPDGRFPQSARGRNRQTREEKSQRKNVFFGQLESGKERVLGFWGLSLGLLWFGVPFKSTSKKRAESPLDGECVLT